MRKNSCGFSWYCSFFLWFMPAAILFSAATIVNFPAFASTEKGVASAISTSSAKGHRSIIQKPFLAVTSSSETVTVDGKANIFASGLTAVPSLDGGGGELPSEISLSEDVTNVSFSATGLTNCCSSTPNSPPDGGSDLSPTDIFSYNGISGIKAPNTMMLVGVFLGDDSPSSDAPDILDFNAIGTDFTTLSPELQQTFYIGDGSTSSGTTQSFVVPSGATRLFLGIADAASFNGDPSWYDDNTGSFEVTANQSVTNATPTPTATLPPLPTPSLSPLPFPSIPPFPSPLPTVSGGTAAVTGIILDQDDIPLSAVTVTIEGTDYSESKETDENGFYIFTNLLAGEYTLTYKKEGYQTQTEEITLTEGEQKNMGMITMEESVGTISGYVLDIRNNPIASAKLKLKGIKTGYKNTLSSDADGFFEFTDLEADTYILIARKNGYKRAKQTIKLGDGEAKEVEITLKRAVRNIKKASSEHRYLRLHAYSVHL